jgi:hypothetical protein
MRRLLLAGIAAVGLAGAPGDLRAQVGPSCTVARDCDDGNLCTDDLCDGSHGCRHASNSTACSDGNSCTTGDACNGGACVGGNVVAGCTSCAAAATIPADGGTFAGTTSGTGTLAGTCSAGDSSPERVYRWTPQVSGLATISTCGTSTRFDTVAYLRSGSCTGAQVACNDDTSGCAVADGTANASRHGSRLSANVVAGQTYYIVVDGYGGAAGGYVLTVAPPSRCGNGVREGSEQCDGVDRSACATASCTTACTCVVPRGGLPDLVPEISDVSIQRNTTVAAADVVEGCAERTSGVDLLRFSATSRNIGSANLALGNPGCPSPCSSHPLAVCTNRDFICSPAQGHNHAHYNNYARYELLDGSNQATVVGHKQGFCLRDTSCARPTYTCTNQGISAGCADLYSASLGCQYLDITGIPPGSYTLRVTMDPFGRIPELNEGNNVASVPVVISGSSGAGGGTCPGPTDIPAGGGSFSGFTTGVSALSGCVAQTAGAPEKVFRWTPAVSGRATLETCGTGTGFDTVLYVRSGGCGGGAEVACNDDTTDCGAGGGCASSAHHGSRVSLDVTAGQTYFVVVDGYEGSCGGASGSFTLRVTAPAGSPPPGGGGGACASPTLIPAGGGTFTGSTTGASTLAGQCSDVTSRSPERVFQWTPARSGVATVDTCSGQTDFDTVIYIRRAGCTGTQVGCDDDSCGSRGNKGSRLRPTVTAGVPYFIVVDGDDGDAGAFTLRVTPPE